MLTLRCRLGTQSIGLVGLNHNLGMERADRTGERNHMNDGRARIEDPLRHRPALASQTDEADGRQPGAHTDPACSALIAAQLSATREREEVGRRRTLQGEGQEFVGHRPYRPGEDLRKTAEQAVRECPTGAIALEE